MNDTDVERLVYAATKVVEGRHRLGPMAVQATAAQRLDELHDALEPFNSDPHEICRKKLREARDGQWCAGRDAAADYVLSMTTALPESDRKWLAEQIRRISGPRPND
jgi:hypothetical protein